MMRWILNNLLGNKSNATKASSQVISPTFMLEHSIAYTAFVAGSGEKISFSEFVQRRAMTH